MKRRRRCMGGNARRGIESAGCGILSTCVNVSVASPLQLSKRRKRREGAERGTLGDHGAAADVAVELEGVGAGDDGEGGNNLVQHLWSGRIHLWRQQAREREESALEHV